MRMLGHHSGRGATHPPSDDPINQSTKESSSIARAGANCTNEAVGYLRAEQPAVTFYAGHRSGQAIISFPQALE